MAYAVSERPSLCQSYKLFSRQLGRKSVDTFIASSVRRGNKVSKFFVVLTLVTYIIAAKLTTILDFPIEDKMPAIFVITKDCLVMNSF